jgi:hypothetical protein
MDTALFIDGLYVVFSIQELLDRHEAVRPTPGSMADPDGSRRNVQPRLHQSSASDTP